MQPAEERPNFRPKPTPGTGWKPESTPDQPPAGEPSAGGSSGAATAVEAPAAVENPFGTPTVGPDQNRAARRMPAGVTPGVLVASIGALLTFLAAFLTWANVEVTSRIGSLVGGGTRTNSGIQGDHFGKATLVLALAALALCFILTQPTSRSWGWIVLAVFGALIVLLAVIDLAATSDAADLRKTLAQTPGCSQVVQCTGSRSGGIGVYLTIVGGLVVLIGALLHHGVFERLGRSGAAGRQPAVAGQPTSAAAETPAEAPAEATKTAETPGTAEKPAATGTSTSPEEPTAVETTATDDAPATADVTAETKPTADETAETGRPAT